MINKLPCGKLLREGDGAIRRFQSKIYVGPETGGNHLAHLRFGIGVQAKTVMTIPVQIAEVLPEGSGNCWQLTGLGRGGGEICLYGGYFRNHLALPLP